MHNRNIYERIWDEYCASKAGYLIYGPDPPTKWRVAN